MKPLVRLADLKARHAGQANWSELVVYGKNNRAEVIAEMWVIMRGRQTYGNEGRGLRAG